MIGSAYKTCPQCGTRASGESRFCASCGVDLHEVDVTAGDPYLGLVLADKYVIEELIGEGAMGRVYKAKQTTLGKPFAAKILAPHLLHDEQSRARFAAEAHNAASLNHPNCVSVVDYGQTAQGIAYIVMEYIRGVTLERIITEQFPLARERIVDLVVQILAALTEAHGLGILHRDLKPENILVQQLRTHGELAKVLDFGIAKLMEAEASAGTGLTSQGMVCGTPEYMSPEQARGHKLDQRSDLYAVGVILYQMMTGRPPFESTSAVEVLHKHLSEEPIPPSELLATDPSPLEAVCLRAMAKDPHNRYASAAEFREELIAASAAGPSSASPRLHCTRCGADMRADHRFCPTCGARASVRGREGATFLAEPMVSVKRGSPRRGVVAVAEPTAEYFVRNFPLSLVGRELVLQRMRSLFGRPQPGVRTRVLAGPRGIGKTRLGDEIAAAAESMGWRAFYVGADPSRARTPLQPVRAMVAQLLELDPTLATTQDLGRVANTTGLSFEELPGLADLFGLQGPAHDLELCVRRRECYASAVQTLLTGGRGQPLLLLFDDIDDYDTPSREILRRLAAAHAVVPVVVLCTSAERELAWLDGAVEPLEPLTPELVLRLGKQVTLDTHPHSQLPEALAKIAPTTPLALEHHLRLIAAGVQAPADASLQELVHARLRDLEADALALLQSAAVLGERLFEQDLRDLVAADDSPSATPIDRLLGHLHATGFLFVMGEGERAFSHAVVHELVYEGIEPERKRRLHGLAAEVSRLARMSLTVRAMHCVRAKRAELVESVAEAAVDAERNFDDALAGELVRFATRYLDDHPELADRFADTGLVLALMAARVMRGSETHPAAIELLEQCARRARSPAHEARILRALGHVQTRAELYGQAIATLKRALGPAIAAGDRPTMLDIYVEIARVYANQNELKRAVSELAEGLDFFTLGEGPRAPVDFTLWRYLLRVSEYSRAAGEAKASRQWCEHALWQAERMGDHLGLLRCHAAMAWVLRDLNQLALAEQHLARALDEARYFGDRLTTAELLIERARARAVRGRIAEAMRCCEEALRLARAIQWAGGIDHAERALSLLTRQDEAPSGVALPGPLEGQGRFAMRRRQG